MDPFLFKILLGTVGGCVSLYLIAFIAGSVKSDT